MTEYVLGDGTTVRIRPITPEDAPGLRAAWEGLSPVSRRRRFFGSVTNLTDEMVRYLTEVDGHDHIALAAVLDSNDLKEEEGVGVARCIRLKNEPRVAEAAVTVIDSMQGRGLGRILVQELAKAAYDAGIRRFRGEGLADNLALRSLLTDLGISPTPTAEGTVMFEVDISNAGAEPNSPVRRLLRAAVSTFGEAVAVLPWLSSGTTTGGGGSGSGGSGRNGEE